jgi:hypothetical protein
LLLQIRKLIDGGLPQLLGNIGWRVKQNPPLSIESILPVHYEEHNNHDVNAKNCLHVGTISEAIHKEVGAHCGENDFPLMLGAEFFIF